MPDTLIFCLTQARAVPGRERDAEADYGNNFVEVFGIQLEKDGRLVGVYSIGGGTCDMVWEELTTAPVAMKRDYELFKPY